VGKRNEILDPEMGFGDWKESAKKEEKQKADFPVDETNLPPFAKRCGGTPESEQSHI
jgi:hypothetical protein